MFVHLLHGLFKSILAYHIYLYYRVIEFNVIYVLSFR